MSPNCHPAHLCCCTVPTVTTVLSLPTMPTCAAATLHCSLIWNPGASCNKDQDHICHCPHCSCDMCELRSPIHHLGTLLLKSTIHELFNMIIILLKIMGCYLLAQMRHGAHLSCLIWRPITVITDALKNTALQFYLLPQRNKFNKKHWFTVNCNAVFSGGSPSPVSI